MKRPVSHYLFLAFTIICLALLVFSSLPFPLVIAIFVVGWCALALIVMVIQRVSHHKSRRP